MKTNKNGDQIEFVYPDKCPKTIIGPNIIIKECVPIKTKSGIYLGDGSSTRKVNMSHYIEEFNEDDIHESLKGKIKKGDKVVVKFYGDEAIVAKKTTEENELVYIMVDQFRILAVY
jgi:co-chaperonin GroES (HSP10)